MVWIFSVVAVALVAIIVELLLLYQKRAHELRLRQEPLRRRVREHLREMQETTLKIRRISAQRLDELDFEVRQTRKQCDAMQRAIRDLEQEIFGETAEEIADVDQAVAAVGEEEVDENDEAARREALREARRHYDEIELHIGSLRRDTMIVRRTMERIESRMQRRLGPPGRGTAQ